MFLYLTYLCITTVSGCKLNSVLVSAGNTPYRNDLPCIAMSRCSRDCWWISLIRRRPQRPWSYSGRLIPGQKWTHNSQLLVCLKSILLLSPELMIQDKLGSHFLGPPPPTPKEQTGGDFAVFCWLWLNDEGGFWKRQTESRSHPETMPLTSPQAL